MSKWGSCDFSQLEKLQKQIQALEKEQDEFVIQCTKELAAMLLKLVTKRTPTGHAPKITGAKTEKVEGASGKSRTFLTKEGAMLRRYWSGYSGGKLKNAWTVGEVINSGGTYSVEVINPTKYAIYVEYGHRQKPGRYVPMIGKKLTSAWVPGKFMMTISTKLVKDIAPRLLEKRLEEWLRGCLDAK